MADSLLDSNDSPQLDSNKAYLEQLVGDGKKFKTAEDLARGKAESDSFIEIMKVRMDELRADHLRLREEHQASAQLKDLIDNYKNPKTAIIPATPLGITLSHPRLNLKTLKLLSTSS